MHGHTYIKEIFFPPVLNPILRECLGLQNDCIVTISSDPELVKAL